MSDIIKFEFDQQVEVSLRFTEPKVFASSFPGGDDRHMYSTTDGRVMYVTPLTSARIKALNLAQGECFFIVKRKSGRLTEFAVFRESDEAPTGSFGGHKKTYPPQKSNLPEPLYYQPEKQLSPAAIATLQELPSELETKLAEAIAMVERCKAAGSATEAGLAPAVAEFSARLIAETTALIDSYAAALKTTSERHGGLVKADDVRTFVVHQRQQAGGAQCGLSRNSSALKRWKLIWKR